MTQAFEAPGDERALVAACARHEHTAFETLLAEHGGAIRAGCRRALSKGRRADLEEAEAEVRKRLWQEAGAVFGGFRFACPLEAWLRLVAYRTALNWLASEGRPSRGLGAAEGVASPLAPDALEAEERLAILRRGLDRLEPRERALLEGIYLEGLDYGELARRHGLSAGSVGSLLTRARRKLAEFVKSAS